MTTINIVQHQENNTHFSFTLMPLFNRVRSNINLTPVSALVTQIMPGFSISFFTLSPKKLNYVLTPDRYVGLPEDEEDFNFVERFTSLKEALEAQIAEENALNKKIRLLRTWLK